jgi:hypothetical protein
VCVDEDTVLEKIAAEQLLKFDDDGGGKLRALLPINESKAVGEEEEGSDDFADALMEQFREEIGTEEEEDSGVLSPNRKVKRNLAHDNIDKHTSKIVKQAEKKSGELPKVGDIVQLLVHEVDITKLLPNHITALVVALNENKNCVRLAVETGVLKGWCNYTRVKIKRSQC